MDSNTFSVVPHFGGFEDTKLTIEAEYKVCHFKLSINTADNLEVQRFLRLTNSLMVNLRLV